MKITIDLQGEALLAFRRAATALRLPYSPTDRSYLARQLVFLGANALASADSQPTTWPVGRLDFRYWTDHESNAYHALRVAEQAQRSDAAAQKPETGS